MSDQSSASDPKQVKNAKGKDKRNAQQILNDYRTVLGTPEGRRLIYHILAKCGLYHVMFSGNSRHFFNDGMRQIGVWLLAEINEADEEVYIKMQSEALERRRNGA